MHTHNAVHEAVPYTRSRFFYSIPCYCQWPFQPSGSSATWPKFNAWKLITQRPLVGSVDTSNGGMGIPDNYLCVYVCVYVCMCVCVCVCLHVCVVCVFVRIVSVCVHRVYVYVCSAGRYDDIISNCRYTSLSIIQ